MAIETRSPATKLVAAFAYLAFGICLLYSGWAVYLGPPWEAGRILAWMGLASLGLLWIGLSLAELLLLAGPVLYPGLTAELEEANEKILELAEKVQRAESERDKLQDRVDSLQRTLYKREASYAYEVLAETATRMTGDECGEHTGIVVRNDVWDKMKPFFQSPTCHPRNDWNGRLLGYPFSVSNTQVEPIAVKKVFVESPGFWIDGIYIH